MYHAKMLFNFECLSSSSSSASFIRGAVVLLLLLLIQLELCASAPLLSAAAFRHTHMHKHHHHHKFDQLDQFNHNNNKLTRKQYEKHFLAMLKQYQDALIINEQKKKAKDTTGANQKQLGEQEQNEPQMRGMRVMNAWSGYWNWIEAETHSVYVFAFTYFGLITLVLVGILIMISCYYMYDCLGCYDASVAEKGQHIFGGGCAGGANSVFPMAPPPPYGDGTKLQQQQQHMTMYNNNNNSSRASMCSSSGRRWSSPIAHL